MSSKDTARGQYYAVTAARKGIRKSPYPPHELLAWIWEIVEGPSDNAPALLTLARETVTNLQGISDDERANMHANLKVLPRGRLKAYHIEMPGYEAVAQTLANEHAE